jgi:hypothetical protein
LESGYPDPKAILGNVLEEGEDGVLYVVIDPEDGAG